MAKRRYDPNASREDILDAAERLFAAHGFGDVSTSRIAKEAHVSQSQIHYHFDTKHKLWAAVFRRRFTDYFGSQSALLRNTEYRGTARMEASLRAYFEFFREHPLFVKLLGRAQLDAGTAHEVGPMSHDLLSQGTEVIAEAQRDGRLRGDVAPQFILIGFLSLVTYWFQSREWYLPLLGLDGPPDGYDDGYLEFILEVYVRGVAP